MKLITKLAALATGALITVGVNALFGNIGVIVLLVIDLALLFLAALIQVSGR